MLTGIPVDIAAPALGDVIVEVGGVVSLITVTVICVVGFCTFPLVSTARLMIVNCPGVVGVKGKLHAVVPVAVLKVVPPSTDTSTRATDPPPVSLAVPVMVVATPANTVPPDVGEVIAEVGADLSGFVVGFLGPLVMHPEENRVELTTASPIRTPKTVTYRLVNVWNPFVIYTSVKALNIDCDAGESAGRLPYCTVRWRAVLFRKNVKVDKNSENHTNMPRSDKSSGPGRIPGNFATTLIESCGM
jgi:hypothetical protein